MYWQEMLYLSLKLFEKCSQYLEGALFIDSSIHHLAVLVLDSLVDIDGEGVVVAGHDVDHLLAAQAGRHGDMVPHAGVGLLGPDQGGHAVAGNTALYIAWFNSHVYFNRTLTTKIT